MSEPPTKRRLDIDEARERAARACGVDRPSVGEAAEHTWGWSFVLPTVGGRAFVDAGTGLVATSEPDDDEERILALEARGPLGVPPWSPLPTRSWWQKLARALRVKMPRS